MPSSPTKYVLPDLEHKQFFRHPLCYHSQSHHYIGYAVNFSTLYAIAEWRAVHGICHQDY